jgi:2-polyprenyl-6-hydroxyphenyl methylase/3-demethylubiquinone-9 3-methyltransferase
MRRVQESEINSDWDRQYTWGDDERYLYSKNRKKSSVMGYFLRLETVVELVKKYVPSGRRIADFACAQGNFALLLSEAGYDVTAVDLRQEFLDFAKKKYTHGTFQTLQANVIEYRSSSPYDCVILGEIIEHVAFPNQLLKSAADNLNPNGILILTTPNGNQFASPLPTYKQVSNLEELIPRQFHWGDHLFLYTDEELRELMNDQGLEVLQILKMNSAYVSEIKAIRYLMPKAMLTWLEKRTRTFKKQGKDSTANIVVVARKKA